jgi:tryptophan-rich sensory protein
MDHWHGLDESEHDCVDQGRELSRHSTMTRLTPPKQGATLYTIQLGLNLAWMPLFFGLKRPIEATADIIALTGVTGYLTYIWGQVDEVSAWALAPYVGWLCFASYLTVSSFKRSINPQPRLIYNSDWRWPPQ